MGEYRKEKLGIIQGMFVVITLGVFMFFILGECILPREGDTSSDSWNILSLQWEWIREDGTRESITVPGQCDADRGDIVTIEANLPEDLTQMEYICFRSSQQDMNIYIDGKLRQRYSTANSKPFGKTSMSAYVFVKLEEKDAGQPIRLTFMSDSRYSGVINTIYSGDKIGIWMHFIGEYGTEAAVSFFMLFLGIVTIIASLILRLYYNERMNLEYLGWGIFFASIWIISESKLRQLIFPNISVVASMAFFAILLLPFPFLFYVNNIQKQRYQKYYTFMATVALLNFIGCTLLQVFNIVDFLDSLIAMHTVLAMGIVLIVVTMCRDTYKGYVAEYKLSAIGMVGVMISAIVEIVLIYSNSIQFTGFMLCMGLVLMFVMAAISTCKDIISMEQEKQKAIFANESKSKFLAHMSHEIRTPINTVIGMNEMILRENKDAEIQGYAYNIENASKTLLGIINDILDFSKIDAGKMELDEKEYQLSSVLNDLIQVLKLRATQKSLDIKIIIDPNMPAVLYGDEIRIRQIIINILTNAVKYTKQGTITFQVEGEYTQNDTFNMKVSVKDTGDGIKKENINAIFDSFSRLEISKNRAIEGTGLGLNITKRLVELMNGGIEVESEYGKGSIFIITIPQKIIGTKVLGNFSESYEKNMQNKKHETSVIYAPNAKILVVDDNEMNLVVVKSLLKRTAIQIDTATGGEAALSICRDNKYDLIFMDHMMPEPDGIETLHRLRDDNESLNRTTIVIALTANAVTGVREQYIKEGFSDYLSKPIDSNKLENMIEKYISVERKQINTDNVANQKLKPGENDYLIDTSLGMSYCSGDADTYREILRTYYHQGEEYSKKLKQYIENKEWSQYKIIVHAIKSTSMTIGSKELANLAEKMEWAAENEREDIIDKYADELYEKYQLTLEAIQAMLHNREFELQKNETTKARAKENIDNSKKDCWDECTKLLDMIRGYEMYEALEQIKVLETMKVTPDLLDSYMEMLKKVTAAVNEFDYESAEMYISDWMGQKE